MNSFAASVHGSSVSLSSEFVVFFFRIVSLPRVVCWNTRFDVHANRDFQGTDKMCEWGEKINHVGRCQDSLLVWRRKEVAVRGVAT